MCVSPESALAGEDEKLGSGSSGVVDNSTRGGSASTMDVEAFSTSGGAGADFPAAAENNLVRLGLLLIRLVVRALPVALPLALVRLLSVIVGV